MRDLYTNTTVFLIQYWVKGQVSNFEGLLLAKDNLLNVS
jgi:hypothetical protein